MLSGEESDDYVMRMYQKMLEKEANGPKKKGPKPEVNGKSKPGPKSRGRPKGVTQTEENETKPKTSNDEKEENNSFDKSLDELREENRRLQKLLEKYEKESLIIINKASDLKQKDKTSVMQICELMKLNAYLISFIPDSDHILDKYLSNNKNSDLSVVRPSASTSKTKNFISNPFISPVIDLTPYSSKSVGKNGVNSNGNNDENSSESDSDDNRPLSKRSRSLTTIKPKQKRDVTPEEKNERSKKGRVETPRRVSPRKVSQTSAPKSRYRSESDSEDDSRDKNESTISKPSVSGKKSSETNSKEDNEKPKRRKKAEESRDKPKIKRKRRPRVEEPKGLFPCTFDPRQCDEIMDTKEHFDFHMSGHYDAKYVCPFCAYTGPTIQIIKRHLNKERETAQQEAKEGKYLNADRRAHKDIKIYQCFGCKVCGKIHDKMEERCEHIKEDNENQCHFSHDMDYEFKDHLKMHFADKFKNIKDRDERKQKIQTIVNKFVEEQYFENNAKKGLLVEKFNSKKRDKEVAKHNGNKSSSDSDWD